MGRLLWKPEEALTADVNVIAMALEGHWNLINIVFGSGPVKKPGKRRVSKQDFREFARTHNAIMRRRLKNGRPPSR